MSEIDYTGLNDFQRGMKRGILLAVRQFLHSLPEAVRTEKLVTKTVEYIWDDYINDL